MATMPLEAAELAMLRILLSSSSSSKPSCRERPKSKNQREHRSILPRAYLIELKKNKNKNKKISVREWRKFSEDRGMNPCRWCLDRCLLFERHPRLATLALMSLLCFASLSPTPSLFLDSLHLLVSFLLARKGPPLCVQKRLKSSKKNSNVVSSLDQFREYI